MQGMAHQGRRHSPVYGAHPANRRDVGRRDSRGEAVLVLYDAPDVRGTDHSSNQCNHKLEADDHEGNQTFPTTRGCIYHDVTGWAGALRRKDGKMKTRTIIIIVTWALSTVLPVQQGHHGHRCRPDESYRLCRQRYGQRIGTERCGRCVGSLERLGRGP